MTKIPTVSIVIPAYNAQRHIEKAIRSVMAQTVEDWELLVLDDGSVVELKDFLGFAEKVKNRW